MIPEMRLQCGIFGVHNQYFLSFLIFSVEFSVMVPDYIHEKVGNRDFRYIRKSLIMFKKGGNWLFSCTKLTLLTFHLICSLDFFWNCTWWKVLKSSWKWLFGFTKEIWLCPMEILIMVNGIWSILGENLPEILLDQNH